MLDRIETADLPDLVTIAKAPMDIRGYGLVKDIAIAKVKPKSSGCSPLSPNLHWQRCAPPVDATPSRLQPLD